MRFSRRPDLIDRWLTDYFVVVTVAGGILLAVVLIFAPWGK